MPGSGGREGNVPDSDPAQVYADQVRMATEDLSLPMATQTLFKRVQSHQTLPTDSDPGMLRKAPKRDADPAATVTTAPGTASKGDWNELYDGTRAPDIENGGRAPVSNLSASAQPRRGSGRGAAPQGPSIDIAAQTMKYGAIKAATTVGVRTNGFS